MTRQSTGRTRQARARAKNWASFFGENAEAWPSTPDLQTTSLSNRGLGQLQKVERIQHPVCLPGGFMHEESFKNTHEHTPLHIIQAHCALSFNDQQPFKLWNNLTGIAYSSECRHPVTRCKYFFWWQKGSVPQQIATIGQTSKTKRVIMGQPRVKECQKAFQLLGFDGLCCWILY